MRRYKVFVTPEALKEIKNLPGHIRQRVRRAVKGFTQNARPAKSKALDLPDLLVEVRRLRIDRWRLVYFVSDSDETIDVVAVRKRPPYDYGDLEALLGDLPKD
ncbi:MAG: type II toxin-antitoxin system RelE/ParE family toxin [Gemmataceae bacterium]|nr:type II toxin-antitoxin system RelE/ParE family toxin [Gemmataceae bacterium]